MVLMENLTHIHVFKTNIETEADKSRIGELLSQTPHIEEWSVDNDDVDRVLRVVSRKLDAYQVIKLINNKGYECRELE
jgi:hypothetical protein